MTQYSLPNKQINLSSIFENYFIYSLNEKFFESSVNWLKFDFEISVNVTRISS